VGLVPFSLMEKHRGGIKISPDRWRASLSLVNIPAVVSISLC
jgi:hypothetical protein